MKHLAPSLLAGLLCLPATYYLTRVGSIPVAVAILVALSAVGGLLSARWTRNGSDLGIGGIAAAFAIGAVVSEVVGFAIYYFDYGFDDPKLGVGISVSYLELGVFLVIGIPVACLAAKLTCHITS